MCRTQTKAVQNSWFTGQQCCEHGGGKITRPFIVLGPGKEKVIAIPACGEEEHNTEKNKNKIKLAVKWALFLLKIKITVYILVGCKTKISFSGHLNAYL